MPVTVRDDPRHGVELPHALKQALGVTGVSRDAFRLPAYYGIDINQGLRTGCNPFFYVGLPSHQTWEETLPSVNAAEIARILEAPNEFPRRSLEVTRLLQETGALVPDERPAERPSSRLVELAQEFDRRLAVFPASCLRPVVRYQRAMTHWSVDAMGPLPDYAFVSGARAHPEDYAQLASYPAHWVDVWETRDGLAPMSSSVAEYVTLAAATVLRRNGKMVPIPKLSAVAPNARRPPRPSNELLKLDDDSVPKVPAWWYTLPILPRHTGNVFMPRVNDGSPHAYLNSQPDPALIDANFSTFSRRSDSLPPEALFAVLNSVWVKAVLETIGTPMGGGALKVEANHLRILPLPLFDHRDVFRLAELGRSLAKLPRTRETPAVLQEINAMVIGPVAAVLDRGESRISTILSLFVEASRARRKR